MSFPMILARRDGNFPTCCLVGILIVSSGQNMPEYYVRIFFMKATEVKLVLFAQFGIVRIDQSHYKVVRGGLMPLCTCWDFDSLTAMLRSYAQ